MAKMVEVTKASYYEEVSDAKVSINADNINICEPVLEDDVGQTKIVFNNGTHIIVTETQEQLRKIIN